MNHIATVINNNQPGWTNIVETEPNVTLDVGTKLYIEHGDYRSRLITESRELRERLGRLREFINGRDFRKVPTEEKLLLNKQERAMTEYHTLLETRLAKN